MRIVVTSVHYADFLAVTLPRWRAFAPKATLIVATSPEDTASAALAQAHGALAHVTDAWTRPGPVENEKPKPISFNKGAGINEAFGFGLNGQPPDDGERCLALDADVVPFGALPRQNDLKRDTIYGAPRYLCRSMADLVAHEHSRKPLERFALMSPRKGDQRAPKRTALTPDAAAMKCLGYFQLFRYRPGLRVPSFSTAGGYDLAFHRSFARRAALMELYLLHLGDSDRSNWAGRTVEPWVAS